MDERVIIEHPDGRRYAVTVPAYKALYEAGGFVIVSHQDGRPYEAPKPKRAPRRRKATQAAGE